MAVAVTVAMAMAMVVVVVAAVTCMRVCVFGVSGWGEC